MSTCEHDKHIKFYMNDDIKRKKKLALHGKYRERLILLIVEKLREALSEVGGGMRN